MELLMIKIFVIANDKGLQSLILKFLTSYTSYDVTVSGTQEALSKLGAGQFDVVVLDLDLGGLDLLAEIRESSMIVDLPVIALSGWDVESGALFKYLCPGDYLYKPLDMRVLHMTIEQMVKRERIAH
jgi:DNA-binding response OmpR family regulator